MKVYVICYSSSSDGPRVFSSRDKAFQWKMDNLDLDDHEWYPIYEVEVDS